MDENEQENLDKFVEQADEENETWMMRAADAMACNGFCLRFSWQNHISTFIVYMYMKK